MGKTDEMPVELRRETFAALVAMQDEKMGVAESREAVAAQFGVDVEAVRAVENEGMATAGRRSARGSVARY